MFEQAVLPVRPLTRRYWGIVIAIGAEVLLVSCLLVGPIISPQLLPRADFRTWLILPRPPAAFKPLPVLHVRRSLKPFQQTGPVLIAPSTLPAKVVLTEDPPLPPELGPGIGAASAGDLSHIALGVLNQPIGPPRFSNPEVPPPPPPAPSSAAKPPIRVGGEVEMARLIKKVERFTPR